MQSRAGRPVCTECRDRRRAEHRARILAERKQNRAAKEPRMCPCGRPATSRMGVASCETCREQRAAANRERAKKRAREQSPPNLCHRCSKEIPHDPDRRYQRRIHDECQTAPSRAERAAAEARAARVCRKCGTNPARSGNGPPVCEDCYTFATVKFRDCTDCGGRFKTRNNSTRCSSCAYKRRKVLLDRTCTKCGTLIDYRSANCPNCAPRNGHSRPIGSRRKVSHGYTEIKTERGWLREHVHVMEQHIGRRLIVGESVHHKNGVRDDNRLANLELWCRSQPSGARVVDLLAYAREIMDRYEGLEL